MISPVTAQVMLAAVKAITTIQVAHLSAIPTIFALSASADSIGFGQNFEENEPPLYLRRI